MWMFILKSGNWNIVRRYLSFILMRVLVVEILGRSCITPCCCPLTNDDFVTPFLLLGSAFYITDLCRRNFYLLFDFPLLESCFNFIEIEGIYCPIHLLVDRRGSIDHWSVLFLQRCVLLLRITLIYVFRHYIWIFSIRIRNPTHWL